MFGNNANAGYGPAVAARERVSAQAVSTGLAPEHTVSRFWPPSRFCVPERRFPVPCTTACRRAAKGKATPLHFPRAPGPCAGGGALVARGARRDHCIRATQKRRATIRSTRVGVREPEWVRVLRVNEETSA
jgi:hypothetical protein